jgi:hypothetical protein
MHVLRNHEGVFDALCHLGHLREQRVQRPRERRIATAREAGEGLSRLLDPVVHPGELGVEPLVVVPELQELGVRDGEDVTPRYSTGEPSINP